MAWLSVWHFKPVVNTQLEIADVRSDERLCEWRSWEEYVIFLLDNM